MAKLHSQLTGNDLHAPKGFELEDSTVRFYLSQSTNILTASVDIVPLGTRNLGSAENPWTELFVSSASVKFVNPDTQTVLQTISATDSGINFGTAAITASAIVDESGTTIGAPAGTVSSSAQVIYNDISNNPFTNNNSVLSASLSIIPTSSELALGSPTKPFKDIYVSSASLYVDGTQVLSSDASTITISTDANQSLKLVETGNDTITFETSDGNIILDSTGTGIVEVSTGLQVNSGNKLSSDSGLINFANGIGITGSIELTGNVDGVDIAGFKSSFDTLEGKTIVSSSDQVDVTSTTNYSSVVQTTGNQSIGGVKTFTANNIFNGEQTFNDIVVNGTGSFAVLESVTGSAKIIGDAFIVLNNNTPSERYAGISVYDSGSAGVSASFQFDGESNDWFYEYSDDGGATNEYGVTIFGPEYNTKGSPTYLTSGSIPKGDGGHHLYDSNISDNGTLITLGSNTSVTGTLVATGTTLLSSSAQIATDVSGAFTAGTGLDLASGEFSVDVSDFMSNGANNYVLTATGTDGINAESGLTYDGSTLSVTGAISSTGDITGNTSDDRLKDRVDEVYGALEKVDDLTAFYYRYNELANSFGLHDDNQRVGLSAQELQEVLPEAVAPAPFDIDENGESKSGENYLTVRYERVVPLLVAAIKELKEEIETLKR